MDLVAVSCLAREGSNEPSKTSRRNFVTIPNIISETACNVTRGAACYANILREITHFGISVVRRVDLIIKVVDSISLARVELRAT